VIERTGATSNEYPLTQYLLDVSASIDNSVNDNHLADDLINYPIIFNNDLAA
jgi:hypothetical protein